MGKVRVIISIGRNSEKFFVPTMDARKPEKVIDPYLRRWDMEVFHRELKQDGPRHLYQRTHERFHGTAKLSLLGELLLEISAIRSMETHLKIGKGTPDLGFRLICSGPWRRVEKSFWKHCLHLWGSPTGQQWV